MCVRLLWIAPIRKSYAKTQCCCDSLSNGYCTDFRYEEKVSGKKTDDSIGKNTQPRTVVAHGSHYMYIYASDTIFDSLLFPSFLTMHELTNKDVTFLWDLCDKHTNPFIYKPIGDFSSFFVGRGVS